jgi:hypothetical protein
MAPAVIGAEETSGRDGLGFSNRRRVVENVQYVCWAETGNIFSALGSPSLVDGFVDNN